ncbi:hypothetical protein VPH35_050469 [Triticum aestivum]
MSHPSPRRRHSSESSSISPSANPTAASSFLDLPCHPVPSIHPSTDPHQPEIPSALLDQQQPGARSPSPKPARPRKRTRLCLLVPAPLPRRWLPATQAAAAVRSSASSRERPFSHPVQQMSPRALSLGPSFSSFFL